MDNLLKLIHILGRQERLTIRQLSIAANIPYTTVHRLMKSSLFKKETVGRSTLCKLSTDPIVKHYLIIAERVVAEDFVKRYPMFRVLRQDLPEGDYSVILFGSRAVGTHRQKSDVDLCIINSRSLRFTKLELIYNLRFNPIHLEKDEFSEMLRDKENNVAKEILKKHIVLYGEELFWTTVSQAPSR